MSADVAARLRMLAQDHHDGRLDLAAYRALRAPLLDSLVLNKAIVASAMEITQPRATPARPTIEDATTRPGKPGAPTGANTPSGEARTGASNPWVGASADSHGGSAPAHVGGAFAAQSSGAAEGVSGTGDGAQNGGAASDASVGRGETGKRPPLGAIAIGVALIAVAAVGFWMWRGSSSGGADSRPVAAGAADHVHDLVTPFVDRGDWSDGRLASLNASLLELGGAQIAMVAREAWFQRFVDELRRRLKEQQALASTPLTVDNSPLAALAVTVGIDLSSPDSEIHIAALPPPPPADDSASAAKAADKNVKAGARHAAGHGAADPSAAGPSDASATHSAGNGADAAGAAATNGSSAIGGTENSDSTSSPGGTAANSGSSTSGPGGTAANSGSSTSGPAGTVATSNGRSVHGSTGAAMASAPSSSTHGAASSTDAGENACRAELVGSRRPLCHDTLPTGSEAPLMALVPAGTFSMGSTVTTEEQPVHRVTIREPFAISVYEVSQGEFEQFCEQTNRSCATQPWSGDDFPVVNVSWDDARAYTEWLTSLTHHRYSLPSESQWEYAARAGQTNLFPGGDSLSPTDAHYSMVTKQTTAARRTEKFKANAFRLVHVVGNVREWVEDGWSPNFSSAPNDGSAAKTSQAATRVARGGSYTDGAARLRLSMREGLPAGTRDTTTGFRIVRELP